MPKTPGTMLGYKVMRFDRGRAVSGADSRQSFRVRVGAFVRMPGKGVFLSPNKQYVLDYYGGHNDREVLLTLEFDPDDITSGANTLHDREPELTVRSAKIVAFKVMDNEEAMKTLFSDDVRDQLTEAARGRVDYGRIKQELMSNDPSTFDDYGEYSLHGSLKDRVIEILWNQGFEAGSAGHSTPYPGVKNLLALAKKERFGPAAKKAWDAGVKAGKGG